MEAEEYPSIALKGHVTDVFCQSNDANRNSHDSNFRVIALSGATVFVHVFVPEEPVKQVEKPYSNAQNSLRIALKRHAIDIFGQ